MTHSLRSLSALTRGLGMSNDLVIRRREAREKAVKERKQAGVPGLRAAINAFCRYCIVDPKAEGLGTSLEQIRACPSNDCPLYKVRPGAYSKGKKNE